MRSQPERSRPIGAKRPRYIGGRPQAGSRPQASERSIWRATTRAARSQGSFPRRPCPCDGYSPDSHRAHGARSARASLDHNPSTREWPGPPAWRAVERTRARLPQDARHIAGRSRPSIGRQPRPAQVALLRLQNVEQRYDRISGRNLHLFAHPLPLVSPRPGAGAGEERVGNF